ncbi:MAG: UvrD-helicase domain-containing protein [Vicinamibacterales bacterium]|jgi:DNA helicase-2/ATP-dependent DNA helicase PcrA|nr:UvrD-helicase domain-containing protein [Vicinamibacterales bacterium]
MDFLQHLNPEQRRAVLQTEGPLLILAGAGSGKTRVISHRAAYLIGEGHAEPDQVLAVTFTNKAAGEMRERVEELLATDCRRLWISTFHAFCARMLRREGPAIGLSRDFVIYDSSDQMTVVRRALRELDIDDKLLPARQALSLISQAKNQMVDPETLRDESWSARGELAAKVYERYRRALHEANALDFDDLLLRTVELFATAAPVKQRYSRRFRFIMVDEYQDTNQPQYLLIRHLADHHRNLCVVGDPDQSIYKWRGADLRNIMDFEQDFSEATVVRLEQNYRSTQVILDAASALIRQNRNRKEKRLWTDQAGGASIRYFRGGDELEEADFVTTRLREALAASEKHDELVGVLYRTNAQSRALEDALIREGLAYRIIGSVRFYERKEIKDALAYLRLLMNPDDDVSLRRVINVPTRGIGKGVMTALDELEPAPVDVGPLFADGVVDTASAGSLWRRLTRAIDDKLLPTRAVTALRQFRDLIRTLSDIASREPVSDVLGKLLNQSGYLENLREQHTEEAEGRLANLMELVSAARDYEVLDPESSLSGFVDRLALLSETDEEQGAPEARIWLMTLHAAKGLEFPAVFMVGMEEGLFPHMRSQDDAEALEEERRLCYVGMTRAKTRLVLTSAARRRVFGEYRASDPSRFLDEIPAELLEVVDPVFSTPAPDTTTFGRPRRGPRRHGPTAEEEIQPDYGYDYEDENQSVISVRPGTRVRHATFGVGTILSVEPLTDDMKLTVRFADVGQKTLRARYARLTLA